MAECTARVTRLAALLDDAEKNKFNPLRGKTGVTPDSFWQTVNGKSLQSVGPGTPELNTGDYISLFSRVQNYGKAGADLADKVKRALEMVDINTSIYTRPALDFVRGMTPDEQINLWEVLEQRSGRDLKPGQKMPPVGSKKIDPISERVKLAVEFLNSREGSGGLLDHLANIAHSEGVLQERLPFYKPIMYPTELLESPEFKNSAIDSFAAEQARIRIAKERQQAGDLKFKPSDVNLQPGDVQPIDRTNAALIFDRYIIPQSLAVAPHLELRREWDVAGQITDPEVVLPIYIKQMWRRVTEHRIFGDRDHLHDFPRDAKQMLGQIEATHGKAAMDEALILVKDLVGISPADPTMNSFVMRTLSNMQGLKLSLSALRNLTQQVNTALRGDVGSLGKAWSLYLKDGQLNGYNVRELAKDIGFSADLALYDSTLYKAQDAFGRVVEASLEYTGFAPVERRNRMLTGIAGAVYADKQAGRLLNGDSAASKRLLELGILPDEVRRNNGISQQDMLLAGRRFIDETQFRTRPGDLPFFAQDPLWRFLLQFRTFSVNQTRFIVREIQRGWGDPRRMGRQLMFALGVMPAAGYTASLMQEAIVEVLPWVDPRKREARTPTTAYLESWAGAGSFGLVSDLAWATYMAGESKAFANFFTPPGIGTLNDSVAIMAELSRGKGSAAFRDFTRQFGGLGAAFGRYVAPAKAQQGGDTTELGELASWLDL